jgi:hypothetical protein
VSAHLPVHILQAATTAQSQTAPLACPRPATTPSPAPSTAPQAGSRAATARGHAQEVLDSCQRCVGPCPQDCQLTGRVCAVPTNSLCCESRPLQSCSCFMLRLPLNSHNTGQQHALKVMKQPALSACAPHTYCLLCHQVFSVSSPALYGGSCHSTNGTTRLTLPCNNTTPCPPRDCVGSWVSRNCSGACGGGGGLLLEEYVVTVTAAYNGEES